MGAVALAAWERIYDRVVAHAGDWPRPLWLAAVEDGLTRALAPDSRLLAEFRQHSAALKQLENARTETSADPHRLAQLEADITRLIGRTDQAIRRRAAETRRQAELAPAAPAPWRERGGAWLGALALGVVLFCGVLLGATYYQNQRMAERVERDLTAFQDRLRAQDAEQRAALQARISSIDRVKQDLDQMQAQLRAAAAEFSEVMSQSARSIVTLSDSTIGDLARRLADQEGDVTLALDNVRARTVTLDRGLDQIDRSLAALTGRLPELDSGMDRLAERVATTATGFERVAGQVETIKAQAPEIALWLEGQRQGLAQNLENQRQTMEELDFEIATLRGVLNESRGGLVSFNDRLEQDLSQAKQQGDALTQALDRVRATELRATALVTQVDARIEATQSELQERIDDALSDLAEAADLALLRGEDVVKRAESEAARRLEAASEQAVAALTDAQRERLAELSRWATTTRTELSETRAGLIAGWRGMDEAVAERQSRVLADLDQYAATLEGRVQELLDALDLIVARSNG
jgi:DNA repair exonuclease SbcCD ATPase subunit